MIRGANATIRIDLGRVEANSIVYRSLKPETRSLPSRRVESRIRLNDAIIIEIQASDIVALRAAVNSYMRLVRAAKDVVNLTGIHPC
jgi:tRNA threonylcarbamoyladenosine modification (KEOPS) complex  Pcc1 subunit